MILDRNEAIAALQDPFGNVWGVRPEDKQLAFWVACKKNKDGELVIPNPYPIPALEGKWSKSTFAIQEIRNYLMTAWDYSDAESAKETRKEKNDKIENKRLKIEEAA